MADNEVYERVKSSLDIADIIGERVRLRPASRGYSGLCPFHDEGTPSFHVYTDTQSYYCFGCHEAGDIFTFLMKTENMNFHEALEELAHRAGIELPKYDKKSSGKTSYEILELTAKFYAENLASLPGGRAYLEGRGLNESDMQRYSLGYSPDSWDMLVKYLRKQKVTDKQMLDLGLALHGKYDLYDRFRGRVIFPIKDIGGRVIAFGGRQIIGDGAKYINSPESEIYRKRKNLYLLDRARESIRNKRRSILVEGYMDAIRLHKNGFTESVASLGTSLTPEQAETLSRFADRCYICYDSDNAGKNATLRSMFTLQKHGLDVYVINLPDKKDPDEYLMEHSPNDFEEAIKRSRQLVVQYIESLRPSLSDPLTRKSALRELFGGLSEIESHEVLEYERFLSEATNISPSKIEEYFASRHKHTLPEEPNPPAVRANIELPCEAALCSLLFRHVECRLSISLEEALKLVRNPTAQDIICAIFSERPESLAFLWTTLGETWKLGLLARGDEYCARMKGRSVAEKWQSVCSELKAKRTAQRVSEILAKVRKSQATPEELLELRSLKSV